MINPGILGDRIFRGIPKGIDFLDVLWRLPPEKFHGRLAAFPPLTGRFC